MKITVLIPRDIEFYGGACGSKSGELCPAQNKNSLRWCDNFGQELHKKGGAWQRVQPCVAKVDEELDRQMSAKCPTPVHIEQDPPQLDVVVEPNGDIVVAKQAQPDLFQVGLGH